MSSKKPLKNIDLDFFSYQWSTEEDNDYTLIRIYGITKDNKNVYVKVENYTPYCYVELHPNIEWTQSRVDLVVSKLCSLNQKKFQPIGKDYAEKRKLYYAHKVIKKKSKKKDTINNNLLYTDRKFSFLFFRFKSSAALRSFSYALKKEIDIPGLGKLLFNLHEHEGGISPILKLFALKKLPPAGWINVKGIVISNEDKESSFDYEIACNYESLKFIECSDIPYHRILSFDCEANSTVTSAMPDASKPNDKIFQIGCVSSIKGIKESYLFSLGKLDQKIVGEDVIIRTYKTEADLIISLCDFIKDKDFNVIIGYNILGWDFQYLINRAKFNKCLNEFDTMGCLHGIHAKEVAPKFESKAYSAQKLIYLDAEGRLFIDLLPVIRRDYKLLNYRLKTVTTHFGLPTKDPLTAQDIFKCYRDFTPESLSVCGKYCFVEGTKISLSSSSVAIENLINNNNNNNNNILSYDEKLKGIVISEQSNFFDNGEHECVELTFEDGTTLTCTPDHKIMTSEGEWTKAEDLVLNEDRVKTSMTYPLCDVKKEMEEYKDWSFNEFNFSTYENYNKTLAFCRLLGLIITDGHISKDYVCYICVGTLVDVESVKNDVFTIINKIPHVGNDNFSYRINLPIEFRNIIRKIPGLVLGKKLNQEYLLPSFINKEAPLPIIREFLGGLFGGDGHTTSYNKSGNKFTSVGFSQSKNIDNIENLESYMNIIMDLLKLFDIKCKMQNKKKNKCGDGYTILFHVEMRDIPKFYNCIGFKHCVGKNLKLAAVCSYYNLKHSVLKQAKWIQTESYSIKNKENISVSKAVKIAHENLKKEQVIFNEFYSLPIYRTVESRNCQNFKFETLVTKKGKFPTAGEYLKDIDAFKFFSHINPIKHEKVHACKTYDKSVSTFNLKIIGRKNIGKRKVYDIEVKDTHSFVANSIVVHNCVKDAYITLLLFEKIQMFFGLCEMANTAHVPIFYLYSQGTQIQMFSQVLQHCMYNNYVIISKGYVPKDDEGYMGATVLDPVPGKYKKVLCFDFASLYPSIMMAYNIDYTTLVKEPETYCIDFYDDEDYLYNWKDFPCFVKFDIGQNDVTTFIKNLDTTEIHIFEKVNTRHELKTIVENIRSTYPQYNKQLILIQKEKSDIPDEHTHIFIFSDHSNCCHDNSRQRLKNGEFSKAKKKILCQQNYFRFMKEKYSGKGVVPSLLESLISRRKLTRKEIAINEEEIKTHLTYLISYQNQENKEDKNLYEEIDTFIEKFKEENKKFFEKLEIINITEEKDIKTLFTRIIYLNTLNQVLDKRQSSYKICANSMYGAMGARKGYLPLMPAASAVTYKGRISLDFISKYIPKHHNGISVYGDTDSVMAFFEYIKNNVDANELAEKITKEMEEFFPKPMKLEFEKIYEKYIILSKKRYMAHVANKKGEIIDFTKKGVCLARRDNCKFLRDVYLETVMMMLDDNPDNIILNYIIDSINTLFSRKYSYKDFVITKGISRGEYNKNRALPCHAQLAERMKSRGIPVSAGSRIEYIFTTACQGLKKFNQGDKAEDLDYFTRWRQFLRVDYLYYMEKQIIKPLDELLKVGLTCKLENFVKNQYALRLAKFYFVERIKELSINISFDDDIIKKDTKVIKKQIAIIYDDSDEESSDDEEIKPIIKSDKLVKLTDYYSIENN